MKIEEGKFVAVTYDLHVNGEDSETPELMEKATDEAPMTYIHGMGMMLEAFEQEMSKLSQGDSFTLTLTPDLAYGEFIEENVVELPKSIFEIDGKIDTEVIFEGNTVPMMTQDGQRMNGAVLEIKDDTVKMDFNHPLAGETLHFTGKILEVRDAKPEEIAQIMGESGCGCGCDSSDCGDSCASGDCSSCK